MNSNVLRAVLVLAIASGLLASTAIVAVAAPGGGQKQSYILVTGAPLTAADAQQLKQLGATVTFSYRYLPGAAISISPQKLGMVESLRFVRAVYSDGPVFADAVSMELPAVGPAIDHTYNLDLINAEAGDVSVTGAGVYVAVLDTGLIANWRDFLPEERVATDLGRGFTGSNAAVNPTQWQFDTGGHGTAVAATIVGYRLQDDRAEGGILTEPVTGDAQADVMVRGAAPGATIIPVKVLSDPGFGFFSMIIAGIDYVTFLVTDGPLKGSRVVINMSLGGGSPSRALEASINRAVAAGVVVVASAGNSGNAGMGWPGAYPKVISAGAIGYNGSFGQPASGVLPADPDNTWWFSMDPSEGAASGNEVFIVSFSSRENQTRAANFMCEGDVPCVQDLDVLSPGRRVLLPFPCSNGIPTFQGACGSLSNNPSDPISSFDAVPPQYAFISGTSFSAPHTAGVVALMLEANPSLTAAQIEQIFADTAIPLPSSGSYREVNAAMSGFNPNVWDDAFLVATGDGLLDAAAAVDAA